MSTNNREFDFFALMASLEAHMLKDPNVRDTSPSEALENYFSRKGKRSQRRKNAFRAQRHRRDVMAEKFDTTSKNDGILRKTYKDGYAKFESSHGRVKKEDKSNSYHCKHPRERRRIEAANSKLADYIDHFGFMGVAPLYGYWDGSMNNSGFDVIAHGQSIASNLEPSYR